MNKSTVITSLEQSARRRRFSLFSNLFSNLASLERPRKILDLGGTWDYRRKMDWTALGSIEVVLLNGFAQEGLPCCFKSVVGDARGGTIVRERVIGLTK